MKRYVFFVSVAYSYPILRPLQEEIWSNGDEVAWFIEPSCPVLLLPNELLLSGCKSVIDYNPIAIFAPGNYIYDFFPGVKVCLFHGYPINKRGASRDDHFALRGWFDIYCTQGKTSTLVFRCLEGKNGYFKVYETGWCKADAFAKERLKVSNQKRPTILYSCTFTKNISSASSLYETIKNLTFTKDWDWIISLHPKLSDKCIIEKYKKLAMDRCNVVFNETSIIDVKLLNQADVLLSDSSSIIVEFMMLDKPVVTYRNATPGDYLINVTDSMKIEGAIECALLRPEELMKRIGFYVHQHEQYLDGNASKRVLLAVDDYINHFDGKLKSKPINLIRKIKLRLKILNEIIRMIINKFMR